MNELLYAVNLAHKFCYTLKIILYLCKHFESFWMNYAVRKFNLITIPKCFAFSYVTASRSQRKPLQSSSLNNGTIHFHSQKLLKKMLRGKNLSLCKHFFNLTSFMKYKENKRGFDYDEITL